MGKSEKGRLTEVFPRAFRVMVVELAHSACVLLKASPFNGGDCDVFELRVNLDKESGGGNKDGKTYKECIFSFAF